MNPLSAAIAELHFHFPKIVLAELAGKTFEANQRFGLFPTQRGHQRVERRLAPSIPPFLNSPQNLQRGQSRRFLQNLDDLFPETHYRTGSTDLSFPTLGPIIDVPHRALFGDALYRTQRSSA